MPLTIVTMLGSLRSESVNAEMATRLARLAGDRATFVGTDIGAMPHYDQDLDVDGSRGAAVEHMKASIGAADGVVICSPEFNHSIPGPLKNALDWLSRPFLQSPALHTPLGISITGPARHEMDGLQDHLVHACDSFGFVTHRPLLVVNSINHRRGVDGDLDDDTTALVSGWLDGFLDAVAAAAAGGAADQ